MFGTRVFTLVISFFVSAYVARYLGPTRYGMLSYAISLVGLFSIFSYLGIDLILYRELVAEPDKRDELLGTALTLKLIGGVVGFIIVSVFLFFFEQDMVLRIISLLIAGAFLFQPVQLIIYLFQANVTSEYPSYVNITTVIILSILKIIFIVSHKGPIWFGCIFLLESIIYAILYIYLLYKTGNTMKNWRFDSVVAKKMGKDALPLIFVGVFALIYSRIDQVMIGSMLDIPSVGIYDAAVRVAEAWYFIPGTLVVSLTPAIINSRLTDPLLYRKRVQRLGFLIVGIAAVICLFISTFSYFIIKILYGNSFLAGRVSLIIYVWGGVGFSLGTLINQLLIVENRKKTIFFISLTSMVENVILNLIFIPRYGINGAAMATLVSYLSIPLLFFFTNLLLKRNIIQNSSHE